MKRISSRMTFFYKRIYPMLMFGLFVAFVGLASIVVGRAANLPAGLSLLVPVLIALIGVLAFRKLIPDLVDKVWDAGDALIVRNKGEEDRIRLSDISKVSYAAFVRPPRVTLELRAPSRFGGEISFFGPMAFLSSSESSQIEQLIVRTDAARQRAH